MVLILWACSAFADDGAVTFDGQRALQNLERLVDFGHRHYGAPERNAAIAALTSSLGRHVDQVDQQRFTARERVSGVEYELTNIVGRRNPRTAPRVLLGSHYDTRLWAEEDSDLSRRDEPIPGANDGTSGVAVLLELLRVIGATPELRDLGIDIVFFDGEEFGRPTSRDYCKGSIHFVRQLRYTRFPVPFAAIILDMVGDRSLKIRRERSSNAELSHWLSDELWRAGQETAGGIFADEQAGPIIDDQSAFHAFGIPAVLVIDLEYPYWHTHEDNVNKISASSLQVVGRALKTALPRIFRTRPQEEAETPSP